MSAAPIYNSIYNSLFPLFLKLHSYKYKQVVL